jgi:tRNA(Ile)-lysidine synthase
VDFEEKDRGARTATTSVSPGSPVTVPWPWTRQVIRLTLVEKPLGVSPELGPEPRMHATLDADRFSMPVTVRSWLPGDWFQPAGMQGRRKKLQDYFSDVKLPRRDRSRIPILVASEGILWVCGQRMDHRFRATTETRRILVADLQEAEPEREIA